MVDENYWATNTSDMSLEERATILIEKAVWEFHQNLSQQGYDMECVVVNPGIVTGPMLLRNVGETQKMIADIVTGQISSLPQVHLNMVDVKNVASGHLAALENGNDGDRYALSEGTYFLPKLAQHLSDEFSQLGYQVTTSET